MARRKRQPKPKVRLPGFLSDLDLGRGNSERAGRFAEVAQALRAAGVPAEEVRGMGIRPIVEESPVNRMSTGRQGVDSSFSPEYRAAEAARKHERAVVRRAAEYAPVAAEAKRDEQAAAVIGIREAIGEGDLAAAKAAVRRLLANL